MCLYVWESSDYKGKAINYRQKSSLSWLTGLRGIPDSLGVDWSSVLARQRGERRKASTTCWVIKVVNSKKKKKKKKKKTLRRYDLLFVNFVNMGRIAVQWIDRTVNEVLTAWVLVPALLLAICVT